MTKNHNLAPPHAGVGGSSAPVWNVYPFRLALTCSEKDFHRERARIREKHGKKALGFVGDAIVDVELWRASNEQERAKDANWLVDTWCIPERDRAILGI